MYALYFFQTSKTCYCIQCKGEKSSSLFPCRNGTVSGYSFNILGTFLRSITEWAEGPFVNSGSKSCTEILWLRVKVTSAKKMGQKRKHRSTRQKQMRLTNFATFRWKSDLNAVHSAFIEALVQLPNLDCLTQSPMKHSEGVFLNNKSIFSGGAALSSCVSMGLITNHYLWRKS